MAAVPFRSIPTGELIATGHDHAEDDLRAGVAAALTDRAPNRAQADSSIAALTETWYSDQHGFGHDCSLHQEVDLSLWAPGCGTFSPVTVATGIPAATRGVRRAGERGVIANGAAQPAGGAPAGPARTF